MISIADDLPALRPAARASSALRSRKGAAEATSRIGTRGAQSTPWSSIVAASLSSLRYGNERRASWQAPRRKGKAGSVGLLLRLLAVPSGAGIALLGRPALGARAAQVRMFVRHPLAFVVEEALLRGATRAFALACAGSAAGARYAFGLGLRHCLRRGAAAASSTGVATASSSGRPASPLAASADAAHQVEVRHSKWPFRVA